MPINLDPPQQKRMSFLEQRYEMIRSLYLADDRPWIVAFSGGKDSSATLQMVWNALLSLKVEERKKLIHIAYVDTGMEHPLQRGQAEAALRLIEPEADKFQFPFVTHVLTPELKHRYFVCVIGRGYAPPICSASLAVLVQRLPLAGFLHLTH
jgi:DNA sulfur modification protein DndC